MIGLGLDLNLKSLQAVSEKLRADIYRKAVEAAAKPLVQAVKAAVPVDSGATKKAIGIKYKKYRKGSISVAIIGARAGQAKQVWRSFTKRGKQRIKLTKAQKGSKHGVRDPAHTLHLAEKGRKAVIAKTGRFPIRLKGGQLVYARRAKAAKGGHFMRRTFMQLAASIRALMTEQLRRGVAEALQHAQTVRASLGLK